MSNKFMPNTLLKGLLLAAGFSWCMASAAAPLTLWFPPEWKTKADQAKSIADAMSSHSGLEIQPRIATAYPEIFDAFAGADPELVYVGSFAQAIIKARNLGQPLLQGVNGKEMYAGVLIYPKGGDPAAILKDSPSEIAFAGGSSSGESSAKAATDGKAAFKVQDHAAAAGAVKVGRAKAAVVKDWWWEANKDRFPELDMYRIPEISDDKNSDNVLTASTEVAPDVIEKVKSAASQSQSAFGVQSMAPFDASKLDFSLQLMQKGHIDPANYQWQ